MAIMTPYDRCANCKIGYWKEEKVKRTVIIYKCTNCTFKYVHIRPVKHNNNLPSPTLSRLSTL